MSTRPNKQTARGRPANHDGRSFALQTLLPVGSFPVDTDCPDKEPHLRRIVEVSNEIIDAAWKEIQYLASTGYKKKTRYTKQVIQVLKTHLPEALKELHTLRKVELANQKEIIGYKDAFDEKNAENKKIRQHEQALVREKDNLLQEIARIQGKPISKRNCTFDIIKTSAKQINVHFELMRSENEWLGKQLLKETETATERIEQLYETVSHYISINKTLEEDLKKKHEEIEEIQTLLEISQRQKEEIIKCKSDQDAQIETFQKELEKISQDNKVLQGMIKKQKHNEFNNAEHNQSVLNEKFYKLKRDFDILLHENSKISEELGLAKEISNIKEADFAKLKTTSDAREQEITKLKIEIAMQSERQVKYETLKQKTYKLFQENQTLREMLEREKENLEKQVKMYDQQILDSQEQKRKHIEEINTLKASFDMKISEKNKQHNQELDRIRQDIYNHGESVNEKLQKELALEKQNAKTKEEEYKQIILQTKLIRETHYSEKTELREAIQKQMQINEKNHNLQHEIYQLKQENGKLCKILRQTKDYATNKRKERDITVLNLKKLREKLSVEMAQLEAASEKQRQLREENRNLQIEMEKLLQEKQQMKLNEENHKKLEENKIRDLSDQIQKLQNDVKHLHIENKKVLQALELEKRNIKMKEEEHDKAFQELKEKQELEIKNITAALEKQQTLHESQQKEKDKQERYKHQESMMEVKEHARKQEDECKNLRLEIQKLNEIKAKEITDIKMEYTKQQNALREENEIVRKEKHQLLLENRRLNDDLRQENDNAKKQTKENQIMIKDLEQLRDKQNDTARLLKSAEDCQRKKNAENLELKKELVLLRREKLELENEFVREKENARQEEEKEKSSLNHKIQTLLEENAVIQKEHSELNVSLQQTIEKQKNEIAKLKSVNKNLENDARKHNTDSHVVETYAGNKELQQQLVNIRMQLEKTQQELDETKSRLSRAMGDKLTDNNPNIADLSDRNRPTKIAERYQEFYDNQWTDAFEIACGTIGNEEKTIETLKGILLETMAFTNAESAHQMTAITEMLSKGKDLPASTMKHLKDLRKSSSETYGMGLYMEYWKKLNQSESQRAKMATRIPLFVKECFEICWLMAVQDPPVALGPEILRDAPFNKDHYKAYTKSGDRLDYVVWPVLLLYQDGPVLCKGVAQCY